MRKKCLLLLYERVVKYIFLRVLDDLVLRYKRDDFWAFCELIFLMLILKTVELIRFSSSGNFVNKF